MPYVADKLESLRQGIEQDILDERTKKKAALKQQLSTEVLKASPYLLGKHVLGFDRFCTPHKTWDKFTRQNIDFKCTRSSRTLVLIPRECFKSSFFSVTCSINFILNNPQVAILIVSSTQNTSIAILRQIKAHLQSNEKLINSFGSFYNESMWNANEITISQRTSLNVKEPTIKSVSKGSIVTGFHPDVIIFDDAIGPTDRVSQAERNSSLAYFQDCFDLLKKETGQLIVVGTRYHKNDLYAHIKNINPTLHEKFNILETPAYDRETGELNFPEILSADKLKELRAVKVGADTLDFSSFESQYMLNPLSSSEQIFKTFHYTDIKQLKFSIGIIYIDPALSKNGCYSAIVCIARICQGEFKGKWACIEVNLEKRNPSKLMRDILEFYQFILQTYNMELAVFCESNGFQALMVDNTMKLALENGVQLPISPRVTTKNKIEKMTGLEPYITQGFLLFREDWKTASGNYKVLMEQLSNFPQSEEVDGIDALSMAQEVSRGRYFNVDTEKETTE